MINSNLKALLVLLFFIVTLYSKDIRVGVFEFEPLSTVKYSENKKAFFIDILEGIADIEEWNLQYIPNTYNKCLSDLENGVTDLVVAASYDEELLDKFRYTQETVISTWATVFTAEKKGIQSLLDLNGISVGVVGDDPYNRALRASLKKLNIKTSLVEMKTSKDVFEAIENGWVDAGVVDRLFGHIHRTEYDLFKTPLIFSPVELRYVCLKGSNSEILNILDYHLSNQKNDENSFYYKTLNATLAGFDKSRIPHWVLPVLLFSFLILLMLLGISVILRRQVKVKTEELLQKNQKLMNEERMRSYAEIALRRSHDLLNSVFNSMHDGMIIFESNFDNIVEVNPAVIIILKYTLEEFQMISLKELNPEFARDGKYHKNIIYQMKKRGYYTTECNLKKKDGKVIPFEIVITACSSEDKNDETRVMILRDVSDRVALRESQRWIRQAQKLEAIGTLAGGIAHDFNNLLMPIMGYTEMLGRSISKETTQYRYVEQVRKATLRARDLVSQILAFSRQKETEPISICLSAIIKEALKLLRATLPSTINIKTEFEDEKIRVYVDPTQIHQVIMNLCTNALHSMKGTVGTLKITVKQHEGEFSGWQPDSQSNMEGNFILMSVKDTGVGIKPEILDRVFEPFFTTKKQGEGTGMGLAVVHGIIRSAGGMISVDTEIGMGTCINAYLPLCDEPVPVTGITIEKKEQKGNLERILYIDDEEMITELAEEVLTEMNYRVTAITDSRSALSLLKEDPYAFDLIITDQTMPELTGVELSREVLNMRPELPIILCTGYSEQSIVDQAKNIGIREYITKPVLSENLVQIIDNLMNNKSAV